MDVLSEKDGCDLDGDGKPDNVLGKGMLSLFPKVNDGLAESIAGGYTIALEGAGLAEAQTLTELRWLPAAWQPGPDCGGEQPGCAVRVAADAYLRLAPQGECPAEGVFGSASLSAGQLQASQGVGIRLFLPAYGIYWEVRVSQAKLIATTAGPGWTTWSESKLCGVMANADLLAAVDAVPLELLGPLGGRESVKSMLQGFFKPDIDTDGKGVCIKGKFKGEVCAGDEDCGQEASKGTCRFADATSAAFRLRAVPAKISGLAP